MCAYTRAHSDVHTDPPLVVRAVGEVGWRVGEKGGDCGTSEVGVVTEVRSSENDLIWDLLWSPGSILSSGSV